MANQGLYNSIFGKKGLYKTIYGKIDYGLFSDLFSHLGTDSPVKRMDIRLAGYNLGEDSAPVSPTTTPVVSKNPFTQQKEGFPMWLVGVFFLGFAVAWRQRKTA